MAQKPGGEWTNRVTATASPELRRRWSRWWWVAPLFAAAAGAGVWIAMRSPASPPLVANPAPPPPAPPAAEPAPPAAEPAPPPVAPAPSAPTDTPSAPAPARSPVHRTPNLTRGRLLDPWHK